MPRSASQPPSRHRPRRPAAGGPGCRCPTARRVLTSLEIRRLARSKLTRYPALGAAAALRAALASSVHQGMNGPRRQRPGAAGGGAHTADQLVRLGVFEQVAHRAGVERGEDLLAIGERGQNHNSDLGAARDDARRRIATVHPRHREVHEHDVGLVLGRQGDRLLPIRRGRNHFEVARGPQQLRQPGAHDRVIFGDDDADHRSGTSTRTRVPRPGAESIVSSPLASRARSRRMRSPKCRPAVLVSASEGSNPRPSSSTLSTAAAPLELTVTDTCVAWEWLTTFRSDSWAARNSNASAWGGSWIAGG